MKVYLLMSLISCNISFSVVPEYTFGQEESVVMSPDPASQHILQTGTTPGRSLNRYQTFAITFSKIPQIVMAMLEIDTQGPGVNGYQISQNSISTTGFNIQMMALQSFQIYRIWVRYLAVVDDNIQIAFAIVNQTMSSSTTFTFNFPTPFAATPNGAIFFYGMNLTQVYRPLIGTSYLDQWVQIGALTASTYSFRVLTLNGCVFDYISVAIVAGPQNYLSSGEYQTTVQGTIKITTVDATVKFYAEGMIGQRLNVTQGSGNTRYASSISMDSSYNIYVTTTSWGDTTMLQYRFSYFYYHPCALYCDYCPYSSLTLCHSCLSETLRTRPPNCNCPYQYYEIQTSPNCQPCSTYCADCTVSASNCKACKALSKRLNPPNCTTCPSNLFILAGQDDCQECANYCNQCVISSTNCTNCLSTTLRSNPPLCATCQTQYFTILNVANCQPCTTYCNECSSSASNCTACQTTTKRSNPPLCQTCPSQMYLLAGFDNCQFCINYCDNCTVSDTHCTGCNVASFRINPPSCTKCPDGMYSITGILNCQLCPKLCSTCSNETGACIICNPAVHKNAVPACINCNFGYYLIPRYDNKYESQLPGQTCDQNQCLSCISSDYRIQGLTYQFCPLTCDACDSQGNCYKEPINCQEGNYIDSSIIKCIQCQSNYYLSDNFCIQCSPQCLKCNQQPYYCTICRFPNLIKQGCILCESLPGLYSDYLTNTCYSICGDGILSDTEQCDDGNDNTLDGCSNCQIDPGYYCLGLICEAIQYPIPTIIQNLTVNSLYNPYREFQLSYNTPLVSQTMNIEIQINNLTQSQFNLTQIDREQFTISLWLSQQIIGGEFQVIFLNTDQITSDLGYKQQMKIAKCLVSDYLIINPTDKIISDSTNSIMQYLLIILCIIISLSILFGGLELFWNLLDLLQTMSYLKYVNTIKPYYLYTFLNLFGFLQFQNLPLTWLFNTQNWVQIILNINEFQQPPELINVDGYTASCIMNILPIFNVLLTGILIYFIALVTLSLMEQNMFYFNADYLIRNIKMSKILYNLKYFINKACDNITKQWIWSGLIRIILSSAYDISFAICLGIYGLKYQINSVTVTMDLIVTVIITLSYLFIILLISIIGSYKSITLKLKEDEYSAVYEGLRLKNTFAKQYNTLLLIKKLIFMVCLVLLYNEPFFQILNIIFAQITQCLVLIINDPLINKKDRLKQVICDIFMLIAEIQLLILVIDDYQALFIYENRRIFGWICVFSLVMIIICQLSLDAYQQGLYYYKRYSIFRKWVDSLKIAFCRNQSLRLAFKT